MISIDERQGIYKNLVLVINSSQLISLIPLFTLIMHYFLEMHSKLIFFLITV